MNRVVVTGFGCVSSLGAGAIKTFDKICSCQSGIANVNYKNLPSKVGGAVQDELLSSWLEEAAVSLKNLKAMSKSSKMALVAAAEALSQAKWYPENNDDANATGVSIGSCLDFASDPYQGFENYLSKGYRGVSPHYLLATLNNMPSGHVSLAFKLRGPIKSMSTACATGLHCIGDAMRQIQWGDAKVIVAGATESGLSPFAMALFCRMRALSTQFNDRPTEASRPFAIDRDGFVMGEGAAILILEELWHAVERGAEPLVELLGIGNSGDAHHLTAPDVTGDGAFRSMSAAISDALLSVDQIGYINAHATSTSLGDAAEALAVERLKFPRRSRVGSSKGHVGHLHGAAGAFELVMTALACQLGLLPPTLNLHTSDCSSLNYLTHGPVQKWDNYRRIALKNSFGFGGTNATICLSNF